MTTQEIIIELEKFENIAWGHYSAPSKICTKAARDRLNYLQEMVKTLEVDRALCSQSLRQKLESTEKERDEARAEVERLNKQLDQAIAERTPHDYGILADQRDEYRRMFSDAIKQVQKERAEVDQLKHALHDARLENSGQAARIEELRAEVELLRQENAMVERTRPEPSRLEIAAMLVQGRDLWFESRLREALNAADALIAIAKEGK